jgi:hypothetical protein
MTTIYTVNNKVLKNSANDKWLIKKAGPLVPDYTIRMKVTAGSVPTSYAADFNATQVAGETDVWDVSCAKADFGLTLTQSGNIRSILEEFIALNAGDVTNLQSLCGDATSLKVIHADNFVCDSVTNVNWLFSGCKNVESGALDVYNYLSALPGITAYNNAFQNCGYNTTTGRAELEQIPSSWGGRGA